MNTKLSDANAIIQYYDETSYDYEVAWFDQENLAVHFGFYDQEATKHALALGNTNRILAEKADIQSGDHILDAGCGRGGSSLWMAQQFPVQVTGINLVPNQVEEANQHALRMNLTDRVQFVESDFCQTPFEAHSFDVVWACESLCHAPNKQAFYQEAFRVLKPGGRLIIAEYIRTDRPMNNAQERLLYSWLRTWAIPDIDTTKEHLINLQQAGFSTVSIQDYTHYTWISLKNLHKISKRWFRIGQILHGIGQRSRVQHQNQIGSIRQFEALNAGLWYYGLISGKKPV